MKREHLNWFSPSLGRNMELLAFGHAGVPILTFPSSMGRYFEWEDFKMAEALRHQLENGYNQLEIRGIPGTVYTLEVSLDLQDWVLVDTITLTPEGVMNYVDSTSPDQPYHFYRLTFDL